MSKKGKLIIIEGIDGCGKSTHAKELVEDITKIWTAQGGLPCLYEREPNDLDPVGKLVRSSLTKEIQLIPETLAYLNVASRIEHVSHMKQLLDEGHCIVCDRFYLSNMAYNQTEHLSMESIYEMNRVCLDLLKPDLILFMNITLEESKRRRGADTTRTQEELFETDSFQAMVRQRFMAILDFLRDKEDIREIDAMPDYQTVHASLQSAVSSLFNE